MAPIALTIIYLARSDGKLEVVKAGVKEDNNPTKEQLSTELDANGLPNFYEQLSITHNKNREWRRKLGGMLMRELGKEETTGKYFLRKRRQIPYLTILIKLHRDWLYFSRSSRELPSLRALQACRQKVG